MPSEGRKFFTAFRTSSSLTFFSGSSQAMRHGCTTLPQIPPQVHLNDVEASQLTHNKNIQRVALRFVLTVFCEAKGHFD
ncbi:hypothetical protein AVEN_87189-1 [Araneus ventricosus]|uniref:Uncharacterized protein n=1 Tax=Araneus ventricosus TaxID=182803 RepID=A0A4Y2WP06_ARAVE|nr:hypothetical protein AVEN_87189-1 [Araneus ventricosus]